MVSEQHKLFEDPAQPPELRDYQKRILDKRDELRACGVKAPLIVAPTGSGKTVIAAEIIRRLGDDPALFLAPRRELIHQTCRKLDDVGVKYGVLMAGDKRQNLYAQVQVASVDTLLSRAARLGDKLPPFRVIVLDEAHVGLTVKRQELLKRWPDAEIIGLTATPIRSDGKAMGVIYDELINEVSTKELTEKGYLVPARYYSLSDPDLKGVRTTAGDYNKHDLDVAMNKPKLVGDIVEHWLRLAPTRRSVVFASSIKHSVALAEEFLRHGVAAEHVDANTPQHAREAIFERFTNGRTQVLCNCTLASIGFDLPELECVVLARPTKSLGLFLQMLGRGLRPAPGKQDCLVLDHSGAVHQHGFATDDRFWTLHGKYATDQKAERKAKEKQAEKGEIQLTCPECKTVWVGSRSCPSCGYYFAPKGKVVVTKDGQLVEIATSNKTNEMTEQDKKRFYCELFYYTGMRGFKPGWAAMKYKERFGQFPPWGWKAHAEQLGEDAQPSASTFRWIKAQHISWARSRRRVDSMNDDAAANDRFHTLQEYFT